MSTSAFTPNGPTSLITANTVHFFALPVWYILGIIVILIALYALMVFLKKRVSFSVSLKK